jgi:hypothetical protein
LAIVKIATVVTISFLCVLGCGSASITSSGDPGGRGGGAGAAGQAGAGGAAGSHAATGGSSGGSTGGATGGSPAGGAGGVGTAGAGGVGSGGGQGGAAGAGGSPPCSNTATDGLNCGSCGHSCLGGDCAGGICQPFLLGTIPDPNDYPGMTMVSGGKVYVFTENGPGFPDNAYQFDANVPSTPLEYATHNGTVACAMNGQLFWIEYQPSLAIFSCTFSSCAATRTSIVSVPDTDSLDLIPGCDAASNEIVWVTATSGSIYRSIHRASATGANARVVTKVPFWPDGTIWSYASIGLTTDQTDRLFFTNHNSDGTGPGSLYYVSTKTLNATPVLVATVPDGLAGGVFQDVLSNGSVALFSAFASPSTANVVAAPLPNGVLSGSPPVFTSGSIAAGVVDQTAFYGTLWMTTVPSDAVVKCALPACSSPTIIARGQGSANDFAQDATAIYWTTSGQTGALWKAAK